jgi:hypothetical protein
MKWTLEVMKVVAIDTEILSSDLESDNTATYELPPELPRLKRENAMVPVYYDNPLPLSKDKRNPQ